MRIPYLLLVIILMSCGSAPDQKIREVTLTKEFYTNALVEITSRYQEEPSDDLLRQKLYYLGQLGWPEESIETLEEAQVRFGLTDQLVHNLARYYLNQRQFSDLQDILDDWRRYEELDEELAQIEIELLKQTDVSTFKARLTDYVVKSKRTSQLVFAISEFQKVNDTTNMILGLTKLFEGRNGHPLINKLLFPLLITTGQDSLAAIFASSKVNDHQDPETWFWLGRAVYRFSADSSKRIMRDLDILKGYQFLVDIYESEGRFDSAVFYQEKVIARDSTRNQVFRKADLYEKRRWLRAAHYYFGFLAQVDSLDTVAAQRAAVLEQKIAYLRTLRELEKDLPVLELNSKKSIENE